VTIPFRRIHFMHLWHHRQRGFGKIDWKKAEEIVKMVRDRSVDLILMSTNGMGCSMGSFVGCVSQS